MVKKARKKPAKRAKYEVGYSFYLSVNRLWLIDKILPKFLELVIASLQGDRVVKIFEIDQKAINMTKFLLKCATILFFFWIVGCNHQNNSQHTEVSSVEVPIDSLQMLKDTIMLDASTEGEEIRLYINKITNDTIIESEILGEMGKETYRFIFNKQLKNAEHILYSYNVPFYLAEENLETHIDKKETLHSSKEIDATLNKQFIFYRNILLATPHKND